VCDIHMSNYTAVIDDFFKSTFTVSSRRTSLKLAEESFFDAIEVLKDQFQLFKKIDVKIDTTSIISGGFKIDFDEDIESISSYDISKSLDAFIRLIYDDIAEESGLYFITEIKNRLDGRHVHCIAELGLDLDRIQNEQHMLYNSKRRKKEKLKTTKTKNPLGYDWNSVNNWDYNGESKQVELYDKDGKILDKIDLQHAIKHYVESLSGSSELSTMDLANILEEHEKSYTFLKLVNQEDMEFDTAKSMLNLNDDEIKMIIKELIELKFLQFVADDEIEITESGKEFIEKQK
jgi:predicted transcriptional regulator